MAFEVDVHYYAAARELCGTSRERVTLEAGATQVREFLALLSRRHPALAPFVHRMRLAVNGEIASDTQVIAPGDELAVLPPVAGGSGADAAQVALCALRAEPIAVDEALAAVRADAAGGIALFVGTVRDHAEGKPVARLDYEAHPEMAQREMSRILSELAREHPGVRLAALHRVGTLAVSDIAVIVAASAAHREQAFAACREAIERIKARVPIWKKEWAPDGSANWVNLKG